MKLWLCRIATTLVGLTLLLEVAPHTILTLPLEMLWLYCCNRLNLAADFWQTSFPYLAYLINCILLCCLLICYGILRRRYELAIIRFADAIVLLSGLYLLNPIASPAQYLTYASSWWGLFAFNIFWISFLFVNRQAAVQLTKLLLIAIAIQSLYAILFYCFNIHQFHSPRFGNRTGGTFANPNVLYPLCLIAAPLSYVWSETQDSWEWRWGLRVITGLSLLALLFTYMRSGWLAILFVLFYFTMSRHSPYQKSQAYRTVTLAVMFMLLLGTILIRTKGHIIGNQKDSSFWGRVYIWKVAVRVVAAHPLFGSGLGTYGVQQHEFMTPRLAKFRPSNLEAKNLYLNVAAELGIIGLTVLGFVGWRYVSFYKSTLRTLTTGNDTKILVIGTHAAIIALALAALVDTPILQGDRVPSTLALMVLLGNLCTIVNSRTQVREPNVRGEMVPL